VVNSYRKTTNVYCEKHKKNSHKYCVGKTFEVLNVKPAINEFQRIKAKESNKVPEVRLAHKI
jgi:hypothetical protein